MHTLYFEKANSKTSSAGSCGLARVAAKLSGALAAGGVVEACHGDAEALEDH
jgi:hypothetical protein